MDCGKVECAIKTEEVDSSGSAIGPNTADTLLLAHPSVVANESLSINTKIYKQIQLITPCERQLYFIMQNIINIKSIKTPTIDHCSAALECMCVIYAIKYSDVDRFAKTLFAQGTSYSSTTRYFIPDRSTCEYGTPLIKDSKKEVSVYVTDGVKKVLNKIFTCKHWDDYKTTYISINDFIKTIANIINIILQVIKRKTITLHIAQCAVKIALLGNSKGVPAIESAISTMILLHQIPADQIVKKFAPAYTVKQFVNINLQSGIVCPNDVAVYISLITAYLDAPDVTPAIRYNTITANIVKIDATANDIAKPKRVRKPKVVADTSDADTNVDSTVGTSMATPAPRRTRKPKNSATSSSSEVSPSKSEDFTNDITSNDDMAVDITTQTPAVKLNFTLKL